MIIFWEYKNQITMVRSEFAKEDMIDAQSTLKLKYSWMSPESKKTLGL